jgi:hypothetical protein
MRARPEKGQTVAVSWIRFAAALSVIWLAAGCGASRAVDDVETTLVEHYIDPLAAAGITANVEDSCRYASHSAEELWHLDVKLRLDAPPRQVADVLESEGMLVSRDQEPMHVQQIPGNPRDGWNGVLATSGDGSTLGLVYNNVTHSSWSGAVGWAEVCPTPED